MNNDLVSVIVPVYNVESYLDRCLTSIIVQEYQKIEIILVDDGSTDGSGTICDKYAKTDDRIKVIHKNNEGQSVARNIGLRTARGQYIVFIDSDDYIDKNMIAMLIKLFDFMDGISFTSCGYYNVFNDSVITVRNSGNVKIFNKYACETSLANNKEICFTVWNKMFRYELIQGIEFVPGQIHEEIHFMREILKRVNYACYVDVPLYYYIREREGNTKSKFRLQQLIALEELKLLEEDMIHVNNMEAVCGSRIMQMEFIIDFYFKCKKLKMYSQCRSMKLRFNELFELVKNSLKGKRRFKYICFMCLPFWWYVIFKLKSVFKTSKYIM